MARPPARPLTELDKYRLDLETRAWVERMRQQPPKAREPEKPMEQMTIPRHRPPDDHPHRLAPAARGGEARRTTSELVSAVQELPGDPGRAR